MVPLDRAMMSFYMLFIVTICVFICSGLTEILNAKFLSAAPNYRIAF